jgi:hypothetical protein
MLAFASGDSVRAVAHLAVQADPATAWSRVQALDLRRLPRRASTDAALLLAANARARALMTLDERISPGIAMKRRNP